MEIVESFGLNAGRYELVDQLYGSVNAITIDHGVGKILVQLGPLESYAWRVGNDMFKPPSEAPT